MNDIFAKDGEKLIDMMETRRGLLGKAAAGSLAVAAGGFLAGCGGSGSKTSAGSGSLATVDAEVLNFALNLEYLEAQYYTLAIGQAMPAADLGTNPGAVTGGSAVPFTTPLYQAFAQELASEERHHVEDIRGLLTSYGATPVAQPVINFTQTFLALGAALGVANFNPFGDEISFLLGAFVFEDVGVTAYTGAAGLISSKSVLTYAAEILGVEAYHAGALRAIIANIGGSTLADANAIAAKRASLDGTGNDDTGITGSANTYGGTQYFADVNPATAFTYARTTTQVLDIVYAGGPVGTGGGFFPNGLNGAIR